MEDNVITTTAQTTEPTIVESANTSAENTAGLSQVVENPTVVEQATPMDANVTYNNLPKIEYQPTMDSAQNAVNMYVQTERAKNQTDNVGTAMDKFLNQDYDYDKNEAGTYWVAGAINDNNTQMSFLETLINEEMYDEMDLQKYYYDTNLATARAYAAQKKKEVAYGFYRAAQERAFAEGELTGWYMPAEGRYMLGQYTVAQNTLENPDATEEEKAKATRVSTTAEKWFAANQLTTRGIKCLAMMNYEENVRHNKIMGDLQLQAAKAAASQAAAGAKAAELSLREFKFKTEEMEMDMGFDITHAIGLDDEEYIGHNPKDYPKHRSLRGYETLEDMLLNDPEHFNEVFMATGEENIRNILGDDYDNGSYNWEGFKGDAILENSIKENNGNILSESGLQPQGKFGGVNKPKDLNAEDKNIYRFYNKNPETGEPELRLYYKTNSGMYKQLDSLDYELESGDFLRETVASEFFKDTPLTYEGKLVQVGPLTDMKEFDGSVSKSGSFTQMDEDVAKTVKAKEGEGYKVSYGYWCSENVNAYVVMEKKVGDTMEYYEMEHDGTMHKITDSGKLHKVITSKNIKDGKIDLESLTSNQQKALMQQSQTVGYDTEKGEAVFYYQDQQGNEFFWQGTQVGGGSEREHIVGNEVDPDNPNIRWISTVDGVKGEGVEYRDQTIRNRSQYISGYKPTASLDTKKITDNLNTKNENPFDWDINASSTGSSGDGGKGTEYNPELTSVHYEGVQNVTMEDEPTILNDMETKRKEEEKKKGINDVEFI